MTDPLLEVKSINKDFKNIRAVNDLSFNISEGEIFALLGPNGAGKTTTVRMLLGILMEVSFTLLMSTSQLRMKTVSLILLKIQMLGEMRVYKTSCCRRLWIIDPYLT